jgi:hypothetical protein
MCACEERHDLIWQSSFLYNWSPYLQLFSNMKNINRDYTDMVKKNIQIVTVVVWLCNQLTNCSVGSNMYSEMLVCTNEDYFSRIHSMK